MNDSTPTSDSEPAIRVLTRGVTAEELAAVTAVIDAAVDEELAQLHDDVRADPSAWERSQRSLRGPLHPDAGAWRSFSA